ncbi:MAG TPA: ABC transporter permease [Chthonomonadaceae bacterium]|nr:ABC transporter permease [Chthonomonadaceae bacterium]
MEKTLNSSDKPHLIIRPSSGWAALNLGELFQFRDLLVTLAVRDIKLRYRQTALGVLWVVLQPLISAGILSFVFGRVAKLADPQDRTPYFLLVYAGQLGWTAFASTLSKTSTSLVGNAHLVTKVYFPRLVLPLSTVFSTLIDFSVGLGMLVVLLLVYRIPPGIGILLLPVWLVLLVLVALGVGLCAGALTVRYRDVQYILPVATQFLMYASPVAYTVSKVPEALRSLYYLNPLAGLLEAFRWSLLGEGSVHWGYVGYATLFAIVVFLVGVYAFKRMERQFADVI